jgi:hypothetical protein
MALKDELKLPSKPVRPRKRATLNGRNVLTVEGQDPNFHYRVVNDVGDRVERFKEKGYEVVSDENIRVGDSRVATPKGVGSPVTASVGGGMKAVVMRQSREWFNEDQAEKQRYVDEIEAATRATKAGDYGKVEIDKGR